MARISTRMLILISGALLLGGLSLWGLMADQWNKKTIITIKQPLEVPGAVLQPGKYVLKLHDSPGTRNVVRVFNEDETQVITTFIAVSEQRPTATGDTEFIFYEEGAKAPIALRSWFYPGDLTGLEFIYPQDRAMKIARAANQPVLASDRALIEGQKVDAEDSTLEIVMITPQGERSAWSSQTAAAKTESQAASSATVDRPVSDVDKKTTRDDRVVDDGTLSQNRSADVNSAKQDTTTTNRDRTAASTVTTDRDRTMDQTMDRSQPMTQTADLGSGRTRLPRTASPLPLVGLAGLLSLGVAAVLRRFSS